MANIAFNDGVARTLQNAITVPAGNRFRGWSAKPMVRGPVEFGLGTGTRYMEEFRTDWKVSFSIEELTPTETEIAQYLIAHLERGGTCTLNTTDIATRIHTALLGDGDVADVTGPSDEYRYTFTASLTVVAPSTPPLCVYG